MEDTLQQAWQIVVHILSHLFNPEKWQEVLQRPGVFWAVFLAANLIVFTETGLLVGFLLPGDSLLVTLGIVAYGADWPVHWLILSLCVSAVVGDTVGYWIGYKSGPRLFRKEKSLLFRRDYLLAAQDFYVRHGGKTIIIARFIPIIRTFAPVVAGIGRMEYRRFLAYNVFGGIGWVVSMILLGYTMHFWLEPAIDAVFRALGIQSEFKVAKQIDKIVIVIVLLSISPMLWKGGRGWWLKRRAARAAATMPNVPPPADAPSAPTGAPHA